MLNKVKCFILWNQSAFCLYLILICGADYFNKLPFRCNSVSVCAPKVPSKVFAKLPFLWCCQTESKSDLQHSKPFHLSNISKSINTTQNRAAVFLHNFTFRSLFLNNIFLFYYCLEVSYWWISGLLMKYRRLSFSFLSC